MTQSLQRMTPRPIPVTWLRLMFRPTGLLLLAALLVTGLRLLAPVEMNWDQAAQLEAAHRLVQGLGLTSTFFPPPFNPDQIPLNLAQAPVPQYLTWWPPGFSLAIALLLGLGLPLAIALKALYGITTLVGWWGWASLGHPLLSRPLQLGRLWLPAQGLLAIVLPLFYTPTWVGTDLFLWAGLPLIVLLLWRAARLSASRPLVPLALAGLIFGGLVAVRYSTLFIGLSALLTLLVLHSELLRQRPWHPTVLKPVLAHYSIFLAASLVCTLPTVAYVRIANAISGVTKFQEFDAAPPPASLGAAIAQFFQSASAIANLSGLPLQPSLAYQLAPSPYLYATGAIALVLTLSLPLLVWLQARGAFLSSAGSYHGLRSGQLAPVPDSRPTLLFILALIPASLVVFLVLCNLTGDYDFVGTPRYYIPAVLPTLLVVYGLASARSSRSIAVVKAACLGIMLIVLAYNLVARPVAWLPGKPMQLSGIRERLFRQVVDSRLHYRADYRYPSNALMTLHDETAAYVQQQQAQYPDALFFIQDYPFYTYSSQIRARVIPIQEFWQNAYVDRPTTVFWVVSQDCPTICTAHNQTQLDELGQQPGLRSIFQSSEGNREQMQILMANLPGGYRFWPDAPAP